MAWALMQFDTEISAVLEHTQGLATVLDILENPTAIPDLAQDSDLLALMRLKCCVRIAEMAIPQAERLMEKLRSDPDPSLALLKTLK
jgi:hypothetical protein